MSLQEMMEAKLTDEETTFVEKLIERVNSIVVELSTDAQEGC